MARWSTSVVGAALCAATLAPGARAAPPDTQRQLAAGSAVKLAVQGDGWVRVTGAQLRAAGLPVKADAGGLQLFADGVEQALRLPGGGEGTLGDTDVVEFYGTGRDTLWTATRTYWLTVGQKGARVPYVVYPRGDPAPSSFPFTQTLRQHKTYYAPLSNGDLSNFFGDTIGAATTMETLTVSHVADPATAVLRVELQGVTAGDHLVAVSMGGAALGTCALSGTQARACELAPPAVVEGTNTIGLASIGAAPDLSLLTSISIAYDHAYLADGDRLKLTSPPKRRVTVGGFSTADIRVVDVTDPAAPIELVVALSPAAGSWTAGFDVPDGDSDHTLLAFTDAQVAGPAAVTASRPSTWSDPRAGELLILSNARFMDAVRPLAELRAAQGWSVALVDLQDVYDEFGAGDKSAFAIRDFVRYAVAHWTAPPRYVLLVGDATFDPRNFTGMGDFDLAPTKLIDTAQMETSSDDWFVDGDGDGLPDLAIGRLPVRTVEQATAVVQKIVGYAGKADLTRGGLFVADQNDGLDFAGASASSATAVADLMPIDPFVRNASDMTTPALLAKLNAGPFLVNYFGHGSVEVWDGLLTRTDAAALTNQHPSIYVSMNCLNGFFHDLYTTSLAETLLEAPSGGAVAVWASSTLTAFEPQTTLNREFLARLTRTSLGEAARAAKRAITDVDARRTWMLFGDPTLFGTPSPPDAGTPDGGAPANDGGAGTDDASMSTADASADAPPVTSPDASSDLGTSHDTAAPADGATDASRADASADTPSKPSSAGCSCELTDGTPAPSALVLATLALLGAWRRRRDYRPR